MLFATRGKSNEDGTTLLPILIIPGFMSSGLQVEQSELKESWVGERIWLNLASLGFEAYGPKGKGKKKKHGNSVKSAGNEQQSAHDMYLRNAWVQHMALENDMVSERAGIQVRNIPGLAGVDYLSPGMFTSMLSYVFGPLIQAMMKAGYQQGVNLDAAPYDWRVPPSVLETRDAYFTRTLDQIERMYTQNNQTGVVLVCHSMGCKIGHYLLNFAVQQRGQAWVEERVHTYCPVGAPHLGAPKALRSFISGDKMGLETFLSDREALIMGRSLGSAPLLLPAHLPAKSTSCAYFRMDGAIQVSIVSGIDTHPYLSRREHGHCPDKLKLTVVFHGQGISTPFHYIDEEAQGVLRFDETFTFRTKPDGPLKKHCFALMVCEPGVSTARQSNTDARKRGRDCWHCFFSPWVMRCGTDNKERFKWGRPPKDNKFLYVLNIMTFWWLIYPIIRYSLEFAFKLAFGIIYGVFCCLWAGTVLSADELSKVSGGTSPLAVAKIRRVRNEIIREGHLTREPFEVDVDVHLVAYRDKYRLFGCCCEKRKTTITVRIKWIPPEHTQRPRNLAREANCEPAMTSKPLHNAIQSSKGKHKRFEPRSGYDILHAEGLHRVIEHMDEIYDKDPLGPRSHSSVDPPPVKRIKAIYGINLPTEVGTVFKRRRAILGNTKDIDNLFKPDTQASLKEEDNEHVIKNGVIYETTCSTQTSGDGTVPYWSLNHVKTWEKHCEMMEVHEVDGAEHREILADKRLHDILIEYCRQQQNNSAAAQQAPAEEPSAEQTNKSSTN